MLLAADVGGTKSLLGLFEASTDRPREMLTRSYETAAFDSFAAMLNHFAGDVGPLSVAAAVAGVAGPVIDQRAVVTNIGWSVAADDLARQLGTPRVRILNDLQAMASSVLALAPSELVVLQQGVADAAGNAAVLAAGTGFGMATLHRANGRFSAAPSETGHADFAARTDLEIELVRHLRAEYGRATIEHVLSGQGFVHLHRIAHSEHRCTSVLDLTSDEAPAQISAAGLAESCPACAEALRLFVEAYGAEAGNVALRTLATGGVYIGGGIAPKILPALQTGRFMRAFLAKEPMASVVARIPVYVIVNQHAGLLGAAVAANQLTRPA